MKPYPAWRYHKTEAARIVQNEAEEKALGPGWADTPAAFLETQQEPQKPAKKGRK